MRIFSPALIIGVSALQNVGAAGVYANDKEERVPLVMYINGGSKASATELEAELIAMADAGVSTIIASFYMTDVPNNRDSLSDFAMRWSELPEATRRLIVEKLHLRGTSLLLSAGGEAQGSSWQKHNPNEFGITFCLRAKYLQFDGADFDLESIAPADGPKYTEWLHQSAKSCREVFPSATLTSAPELPYVDPAWAKGPYGNGFWDDMLMLGAEDGAVHNHMYTQYYNQGPSYTANTYEGLFSGDSAYSIATLMKTYPSSPKDTFFVGKPFTTVDGSAADWVDPASLRAYVCKARAELGWNGGLMFWQHHWGIKAALETYKMLSAPCEPGSTSTTVTPLSTSRNSTPYWTTVSSKTQKFLSTSHAKSDTTRSTSTEPIPDLVRACQAGITAIAPQWIPECEHQCAIFGPGGALEMYCKSSEGSVSDLIRCVVSQATFCRAKDVQSTSTKTALPRTVSSANVTSNSTTSTKSSTTTRIEPSTTKETEPSTTKETEPSTTKETEPSTTKETEPSTTRRSEPSTTRRSDPSTTTRTETSTTRRTETSTTKIAESSTSGKESTTNGTISTSKGSSSSSTSTSTSTSTEGSLTTGLSTLSTEDTYSVTSTPSISRTTETPAEVVSDCQAGMSATQPQWVADCKQKCVLYGPGGQMEAFCVESNDTGAALIECVHRQAKQCMANKN